MKSNKDYIFEAVDLAWRWYLTKELRNSIDSGIRCKDIDDSWIISTYDLTHGTGPGVAALAAQLTHQAIEFDTPSSINQLKELVDGGKVISK